MASASSGTPPSPPRASRRALGPHDGVDRWSARRRFWASSTRASRSVPSTGASSPRVPVTASAPESSRGRSSGLTDALPLLDTTRLLRSCKPLAGHRSGLRPVRVTASPLCCPAVWSCVIGPLRSDCVIPSNSGTTRPPFKERPIAPASNHSQGEFTFSFVRNRCRTLNFGDCRQVHIPTDSQWNISSREPRPDGLDYCL